MNQICAERIFRKFGHEAVFGFIAIFAVFKQAEDCDRFKKHIDRMLIIIRQRSNSLLLCCKKRKQNGDNGAKCPQYINDRFLLSVQLLRVQIMTQYKVETKSEEKVQL